MDASWVILRKTLDLCFIKTICVRFTYICSYLGHVLSRRLDSHRGAVPAWVAIHASHHSCDGWLFPVTRWRMCDISTQEDDRLLEHGGSEKNK